MLIEDNETTSFLNNRLLSRLGVARQVSSFAKADEASRFCGTATRPRPTWYSWT
ncbi:MAG: hypothetical protein WKG07_12715 [Hymenobacter sp.]